MKKKLEINHCFIDTEDSFTMKMAKQNTCDSTIEVNRVLARYFKTRHWDFLIDATGVPG